MSASQTAVSNAYSGSDQFRRIYRRVLLPSFSHLVMIITLIITLFPIYYAFLLSTQVPDQYYGLQLYPGSSLGENLKAVWERVNMGQLLLNTTIVSLGVAFGKIILSIIGAFAFVYFDFRGKTLIFIMIMVTHMLPLPVRIVSSYELIDQFNWIDTFQGLTIPFFASATGILLFRQLYQTIPPALADAARIDGAGPLQFLLNIVMPLSRTNIAALFLIEFIYMWNQYLWPLLIANTDATRQIQIGLRQLIATDAAIEWNFVMAGVIIASLPPLIVLLVLHKNLTSGVSMNQDK